VSSGRGANDAADFFDRAAQSGQAALVFGDFGIQELDLRVKRDDRLLGVDEAGAHRASVVVAALNAVGHCLAQLGRRVERQRRHEDRDDHKDCVDDEYGFHATTIQWFGLRVNYRIRS